MNEYIHRAREGKNDFISFLLTILIVTATLIAASSIPVLLYAFYSGDELISQDKMLLFFGKNTFFLLELLPMALCLLSLVLCVKWIHKRPVLSLFTNRTAFDFKRFAFSCLCWGIFLLLFFGLDWLIEPANLQWNYKGGTFWMLLLISLVFVALQTLFEEVLFRGYLLQAFGAFVPQKWLSIVLTSAFFAAMHLGNPEIELIGNEALLYFFLTAVFLGILATADQGLELSFGFHFINNFFAAVFVTNEWQVFQTDALFKSSTSPQLNTVDWITILILFPFLLYLYSKKYRFRIKTVLE